LNRVLSTWGNSVPANPEAAVREFYRAALGGQARRLGVLLASFDVPAPRVQPVFHWLTAGAVHALDSVQDVARYWRALLHGNRALARRLSVKSIQLQQPMPDVEIALITLKAVVIRRVRAAVSTVAGCAIAVSPFVAGVERVEASRLSFWTAVGAAGALGLAIAWLLRKALGAVAERREPAVRKLVVRQTYNWRLVSGEWESQDETNLAWLDPALFK
jgi:hypothetical protein